MYTYGLNCERRMLDKILYEVYNSDMPHYKYPSLYGHSIYEILLQQSVLIYTYF
jgi:hypothetical protein